MAQTAVAPSAQVLISAVCWCQSKEKMIPVEWVSEGRTVACDRPTCRPGCPEYDSEDDISHDSPNPHPNRRPIKMATFKPSKYDPRDDSSDAGKSGPVRDSYEHDLILGISTGACHCGCGEIPKGKGCNFRMGHDARLRGMLVRALSSNARVVILGEANQVSRVENPIEFATWYDTPHHSFSQQVQEGAARVLARVERGAGVEQITARVGRWPREGKLVGGEFVYTEKASGRVIHTRNFTQLAG